MELHEALFTFAILASILLSLIKFYNVLSLGGKKKNRIINDLETENEPIFPYDMRISFVLLAAFVILYVLGFTMFMFNVDILTYMIVFKIQSYLLLPLNILFFIAELFFAIRAQALTTTEAYQSKERPGTIKLFR